MDSEDELDELDAPTTAAVLADQSQEIPTLLSAIGAIGECGRKPFQRGEQCYTALARLEYLLRTEYIKSRFEQRDSDDADEAEEDGGSGAQPQRSRLTVKTRDDDDNSNNDMFEKCGEFMLVSKKLVPCFKGVMQEMIALGMDSSRSRPLLQIAHCVMKMLTRFTFPLTHDTSNTHDNYIASSKKYERFLEYQQSAKKALIENDVLHYVITLMSAQCGLELEANARSELQTDSLELYLCLIRNILWIPNPTHSETFLHDRCVLAMQQEQVMDVVVELACNVAEEPEKVQYLLTDILYQYFRMEDVDSLLLDEHNHNPHVNANANADAADAVHANTDDLCQQYEREKLQRKQRLRRTRHNKWGGVSRITHLRNGQSRVQSLGTDLMSNEHMRDRGKQKRFRAVGEQRKRIYLSAKVKHALCYVADVWLRKSFTPLMNAMHAKLARKAEFELNANQDCKKWFSLVALFVHYHRVRSRLSAVQQARAQSARLTNWYAPSAIECVLRAPLIQFVVTRTETLFENRKHKHLACDWHRVQEALHVYKEIVRAMYNMVYYGEDEQTRARGVQLFAQLLEEHRGPQLIHDMIHEYKPHQSTKRCLSYCVEAVYYTVMLIEHMSKHGSQLNVTHRKRKRKKRSAPASRPPSTTNEQQEVTSHEQREEEEQHQAEDEEDDDDDDDDSDVAVLVQKEFDFEQFLRSYAANKVVAQYMYILEDYATNSAKLNSFVIHLFNKLAFELNYAPLFFHFSYFLLFDEILNDARMLNNKNHAPLIKFCTRAVRLFFNKAQTNPVMFCEIFFFKTVLAIDDINEPGNARQHYVKQAQREAARKRGGAAADMIGMDEICDEDFEDGEDEYQALDVDVTAWTTSEDELLRNYFGSYSAQPNVAHILQQFLETELQSTRSVPQITHRLRVLGLVKGGARGNVTKETKKRVKPKTISMDERKSIIYRCVHRACFVQQLQQQGNPDTENDHDTEQQNKRAFLWLHDVLDRTHGIIAAHIDASTSVFDVDVSIVPMTPLHFTYMQNLYITDLLTKLGYLAPNKYMGACWWRIPREFKLTEISQMAQYIKDATELPIDADLHQLCVQSEVVSESEAGNGDNAEHKQPSEPEPEPEPEHESESEYHVSTVTEMKQIGREDDTEIERETSKTKEKKEKKKQKKKKKKDKKKKNEKKKHKKRMNLEDGAEASDEAHRSKKRKKSRKRKREQSHHEDQDLRNKRRRLNMNGNVGGDSDTETEEQNFFQNDMDEDAGNEQANDADVDMDIDTEMQSHQQLQHFEGLSLNENVNKLNTLDTNADDNEQSDAEVVPRKGVSLRTKKRAFISDSESD